MFDVKMDFSALEKLKHMAPIPKLVAEVSRETLRFIGDIQKNQMSGRRGDVYLNVDTGHLRRSWFARTVMSSESITTTAFTNVPYARIHQEGGVIHRRARTQVLSFRRPSGRRRKDGTIATGFVSPSKAHFQQKVNIGEGVTRIPKRLFIEEEFQRQMPERYKKAVIKVIEREIKNG